MKIYKPVGWIFNEPRATNNIMYFENPDNLTPEQKFIKELFNSAIKEKDIRFFKSDNFRFWCEILDADFDILSEKMLEKIDKD